MCFKIHVFQLRLFNKLLNDLNFYTAMNEDIHTLRCNNHFIKTQSFCMKDIFYSFKSYLEALIVGSNFKFQIPFFLGDTNSQGKIQGNTLSLKFSLQKIIWKRKPISYQTLCLAQYRINNKPIFEKICMDIFDTNLYYWDGPENFVQCAHCIYCLQ